MVRDDVYMVRVIHLVSGLSNMRRDETIVIENASSLSEAHNEALYLLEANYPMKVEVTRLPVSRKDYVQRVIS